RRDTGFVRFRIDGVLHTVYQFPMPVMNAVLARIKLLGRMDVVEKRRPLDGRIKTRSPAGTEIEMRLSTIPTAFGEKMVMRIFDPETTVMSMASLGFPAYEAQQWEELTKRPNGIILVTGPTGSGKTTTLYSTLRKLASEEINICTIEDPIEMVDPNLNQMQVQPVLDLNFAEGIRALMRQDPDVIMIGEIRDAETANMAVQAALTGHLVFSTLHTNDAPSAIARLMDLGVPAYLLSATMLCILAQRLVRTLCPKCKQPDEEFDSKEMEQAISPWRINDNIHPYKPVGCLDCRNTGYKGRVGLYEMLVLDHDFRRQLYTSPDLDKLRMSAYKGGLKPLRISGAVKVGQGITTLSEIIATTPPLDTKNIKASFKAENNE
ncbi:MAG: GspE/PulE family protein, partial [Saezia sp.]